MPRTCRFPLALITLVAAAAGSALYASDPVAVYARIDRVVMTPAEGTPNTIQVFGVFSVARPNDPNFYQDPARGYLYFIAAADDAQARKEWNDLKSVAGTKQIVAFGTRFGAMRAKVRAESDPPAAPDTYVTGFGVRKVGSDTNYPPIRGLVDHRH
jgi:hypothetical protein